jgi:hypothetical protein
MTFETGRRGFLSLFGAAALAGPVQARPSGLVVPVKQTIVDDILVIDGLTLRGVKIMNCKIIAEGNDPGIHADCVGGLSVVNCLINTQGGVGMHFGAGTYKVLSPFDGVIKP